MAQVSLTTLKNTLLTNVCEVKFLRRRPIPWRPPMRRMFCTNCAALLNSFNGKMVLNYYKPRFLPGYDPDRENLIISWDIFMQDYRNINMDACDLIRTIPANEKFWDYFNEYILTMTPQEKMTFMDI